MLEAALKVYPEGLALLDLEDRVVYWNRAAELVTGYSGVHLVGRKLPSPLEGLAVSTPYDTDPAMGLQPGRGVLVHAQHQRGHDVPAFARRVILRDDLGARIGSAAVFLPAERVAALPHGETAEGSEVQTSQLQMQGRLEEEFNDFAREGLRLGVVWLRVDQAEELRRTHGPRACEAMLESVERTLANALRPGDEIGRWGDNEFLVLSHEAESEVLANHAQVLAGIARTTDFRWWGDRLTLTVSAGAAGAQKGEELGGFLKRAQGAMEASANDGGNRVTLAARRQA
jgi:diguanylate cyclase (GGDEF)-like protein/PAS domain S-box-containing protein